MGLYIYSLSRLPVGIDSNYYVYLLDYGWHEPLGDALHANFRKMADLAAKNKAVVLAGTEPRLFVDEMVAAHFDDPQFSWRSVNGENGEEILPALMISTIHPTRFREQNKGYLPQRYKKGIADERLIIIPLKDFCKDTTEVATLIERVFKDISEKKTLINFTISKEIRASSDGSISDAFILKPSLYGVGVDLKELFVAFKRKLM